MISPYTSSQPPCLILRQSRSNSSVSTMFPTRIKIIRIINECIVMKLSLTLNSATGMRRKSFYVVAVDVYMTGLSMTPSLAQRVQKAAPADVINVILDSPADSPFPNCNMCVTMHFVREVTTAQAVDAFKDAFKGCNQDGINRFGTIMTDAIGANGCKVGEEVTFYWMEGGGLHIDKAGTKAYVVHDKEIERRLVDVYLDPARTVSPALLQSFNEYLNEK